MNSSTNDASGMMPDTSVAADPDVPSASSSNAARGAAAASSALRSSAEDEPGDDTIHRGNHAWSLHAPLSWDEARSRLRSVLRLYAETSSTKHMVGERERQMNTKKDEEGGGDAASDTNAQNSWLKWRAERMLDRWLKFDVDMCCSFLLSAGLLVLSVFSYVQRRDSEGTSSALNPRANLVVYNSQVAASTLFVLGSFISIVVARRRRRTCMRDGYVGKRRTVLSFLEAMDRWDDRESSHGTLNTDTSTEKDHAADEEYTIRLSGNPLTDVYSVFRRPTSVKDGNCGNESSASDKNGDWHKVPSLLLVKGDYIALQVGDIAPASCVLASSLMHQFADDSGTTECQIEEFSVRAGELLAQESFGEEEHTSQNKARYSLKSLPPGRCSLQPQSRELLALCNNMKVFILCETPVERVLHRGHVIHKSPLILRKAHALRRGLLAFSVAVFIITVVLIFVRPISSDLSLLLPLPFLAALGTLPVVTPTYTFLLEVMGTARILASAHPYASRMTRTAECDSKTGSGSLFLRYTVAAIFSRISKDEKTKKISDVLTQTLLWLCCWGRVGSASKEFNEDTLLEVPPASAYLLEKLGAVTALALVDDELACEPHSTPQQLLIPSGQGMKLLDLCPNLGDDVDIESIDNESGNLRRKHAKSFGSSNDSDSDDSDEEQQYQHTSVPERTLQALRRRYKERKSSGSTGLKRNGSICQLRRADSEFLDDNEVQFEDPRWWQYLPSLKCIGLACSLVEGYDEKSQQRSTSIRTKEAVSDKEGKLSALGDRTDILDVAEGALVQHICQDHRRTQLLSLARVIGFSTTESMIGSRGDLSPFLERRRLHIVATRLLRNRLALDRHALGLEESRSWGLLRHDSVSVIVQDLRSKAYQLLTVGDARIVTELCSDSWQGENSTISPFHDNDRQTILDTSKNWSLSDLDVAAFSYTPVPCTLEDRIDDAGNKNPRGYLVDNRGQRELNVSNTKDGWLADWGLVRNQIFLGLLGSAVIPRREIEPMLDLCTTAGIRFVYFSPRNMRRTKELASQMGIDVAWNCAISLRPLDEGQEDPHRMTSTYADWDVNARLPHGVEDVKHHLKEVDNVPLLVSLYTDVTKETTAEMVDVFQAYHDTVLTLGLSHLSHNEFTFSIADMSIGVDVLSNEAFPEEDELKGYDLAPSPSALPSSSLYRLPLKHSENSLLPEEISFVSSIVAHSCIMNLRGSSAISYVPHIIASGRAALEATTSAALFTITGSVAFAFLVLFCPCSVSSSIPFVPTLGAVLYLQVILPLIGLSLTATQEDADSMSRVPPKNDVSAVFARGEGWRLFLHSGMKALLPAIAAHLIHLIAFGELMIAFESDLVTKVCSDDGIINWRTAIRCDALRQYSGSAKTWAGALMLSELALCTVSLSASFISRTVDIRSKFRWKTNRIWLGQVVFCFFLIVSYLAATLEKGVLGALPWYFFLLAFLLPLFCLIVCEWIKRTDRRHEHRAEKLRRLQFETRLGMWSPKETK